MKAKILAIDADAQRFEKTRALMESQGHRVYGAETSVQGLRMATTLRPDLILLDLGLPQMEGYALARELRKHHEVGGVPILAMAAHTLLAESEKALAAGCTAYLERLWRLRDSSNKSNNIFPATRSLPPTSNPRSSATTATSSLSERPRKALSGNCGPAAGRNVFPSLSS